MNSCLTCFLLFGLLGAAATGAEEQAAAVKTAAPRGFHTLEIGDAAPDFSLPGADGKYHRLDDFREVPCLMVIFLCNHCPVSHAAETRLIPFVASMKGKGLAVVAINPNNDAGLQIDEFGYTNYGEDYEGTKAYARDHHFNFPYLYDGERQATALKYGCLSTPHVFIFDRDRRLRYQGRFDDSEFPDPATVHSHDAARAVKAVLAGKPVETPVTRPIGCSTKWQGLHGVVEAFDAAWKKLPVSVAALDDAGVAALVRNPTGKLRVISLWATWCAPCVAEFPSLVTLARRFERRDFELITISMDDAKLEPKVRRFLEDQHAAVPVLSRPGLRAEGRETNNYLFTGAGNDAMARALDPKWPGLLPYTIVVAPGGEILARWSGQVDAVQLQTQILDRLGGFHHPKPL